VGTVEGSLYERLGGVDAITAVVRAFDDRAGKDGRINQKFARTNLDRLTKEFIDQLCQDAGGPCTYTGLSMKQSHTNMGVTNGEFDAFMEDLAAVLDDFKVGKARTGPAPEPAAAHAGRHRRSRLQPGRNPAAVRVCTGTASVSCGNPGRGCTRNGHGGPIHADAGNEYLL
jgi:truncated hemoglobin YjbI